MGNELSKVHLTVGSFASAKALDEELNDKQMAEFLGINQRALKKLYRGELEINLTLLLKLFPDLRRTLINLIEDKYVSEFSASTLPNSPFGFPHKRSKKLKSISSGNRKNTDSVSIY